MIVLYVAVHRKIQQKWEQFGKLYIYAISSKIRSPCPVQSIIVMFFTIIALSLVKFQQVHGNAQLKEDARLLSQNAQSLQDLYSQHIISKQKSIQSDLETLLKLVHDDTTNNKPTSGPKHVLTILSDDQGYADIGYNDDTMVTPTLDFFSSKGIRFTNFYVQVMLSVLILLLVIFTCSRRVRLLVLHY